MISLEHARLLVHMREQIDRLHEKLDEHIEESARQTAVMMMLLSVIDEKKLKDAIAKDKSLAAMTKEHFGIDL